MRTINDRKLYYCLYAGVTDVRDASGNRYGEKTVTYGNPVELWANISPARGYAQTEAFGSLDDYDKVVLTKDMTCPIDENTVLFIDKEPANAADRAYDYVVKRVAKSLHHIAYAVRKVTVS